ncbi:Hybrid PKS-NRPS synthetase ucsA [Cladobotryum mycophilum]|uniref:Hybrid PKS-NRPS synthetase ucsA n=1 Tax=Cladobotryum mycophilum TaxID=491253 RepID=A0ABR0SHB5_9HYPO
MSEGAFDRRLNFDNFYNDNGEAHGQTNVSKQSYLLEEDVRHFDAQFFRINPKEAQGMDPQQRFLLETVYEALESAGMPLTSVKGSQTSVHVGVMTNDYFLIRSRDAETLSSHAATGLTNSILSNRISYFFDLHGPSLTLDTACSSSLVGLHLAVQGLRKGEATQAIVAGVNLLLDPIWFISESSLHMLSPEARSRMWDKSANGYARGEGCAAVVLKPLSLAIRDGDHIECIIRETGVNSDGLTDGLTMPSPIAQAALIRQTYKNAGLDLVADRCQYFECHGTGTQAGDPVEAQAIRDAFFPVDAPGEETAANNPLYCGSIKTIIGHLEGCAGLAGLIKASLAIQHSAIPPNMHFNELSPKVEPFYTNLEIPKSLIPWPETHGQPRRASVNSFGFGGTNAHAILESYQSPPPLPTITEQIEQSSETVKTDLIGPFLFSGRTRSSLLNSVMRLLEHIIHNPELDLDAVSSALQSRRTTFSRRLAIPAVENRQQLIDQLHEQAQLAHHTAIDSAFGIEGLNEGDLDNAPRILGIFTGQGAQAAQMGRTLIMHCKLFRESIEKCQEALASLPEAAPTWSLMEELLADKSKSRISEALFSQPLCTAIQIGLVDLLRAAGIKFSAVVGHSSGEIGAAYAAGLLGARDAIAIAYYRGYVAHLAKGPNGEKGGMMAASMSFNDATVLCSETRFAGRVGVAASNAPSSVTLSGDLDAIDEMKEYLESKQIQAKKLLVDTAYHSHHMHRCSKQYLKLLKKLKVALHKPSEDSDCAWLSSVRPNTSMLDNVDNAVKDQYWVDNMVNPVLFSEAVSFATMQSTEPFAFGLEVGPHPALKGPVAQTLKPLTTSPLPYSGCLERGRCGINIMSAMLGLVWSHLGSSAVDFAGWREAFGLQAQTAMIKNLPSYPWDHFQVLWHESRLSHNYRLGSQPYNKLLGRLREDSQYEMTWRNMFHLNEMPWVRGHSFQKQVLFPAAGYVSLALEAAKMFVHGRPIKAMEVIDMKIPKAIGIGENEGIEVLFTIRSTSRPAAVKDGAVFEAEFVCFSCPDERTLDKTCEGQLLIHLGQAEAGYLPPNAIAETQLRPLSTDRFYRATQELGFGYEGVFNAIKSVSKSWDHAQGVATWDTSDLDIGCTLHPAVLDVAFQVGLAAFLSNAEGSLGGQYLPVGIRRLIIDPNERFQAQSEQTSINVEALIARSASKGTIEVDIQVCAAASETCGIQVDGLIMKQLSEAPESDDRNIFATTIWDTDASFGLPAPLESDSSGIVGCRSHVASFMRMISHKYPRTKILEIGTGVGETTQRVLDAIGDAYWTYTCTDNTEEPYTELRESLSEDNLGKVDFKVLNIESPAATQGFSEGSFDVVIAALALGKSSDAFDAVKNARALLRPGGYLILVEATGSKAPDTSYPNITAKEWDDILQDAGFSGIDSISHDHSEISKHSYSTFVTQAMDDRLEILRDPLLSIDEVPQSPLLIVGGKTLAVSRLVRRLEKMLRRWSTYIQTCESVEELDASGILPGTFILYLSDLDRPFWDEPPTVKALEGLQEMLGAAHCILWVTTGRLQDNLSAGIMVGIGRALAHELPHVTMNFLDFDTGETWDADIVARQLLGMALNSEKDENNGTLWLQEPEIVVKDGQVKTARVIPDADCNNNINANRRRVRKLAQPTEVVEVKYDGATSKTTLFQAKPFTVSESNVAIDVDMSVALSKGEETPAVISVGRLQGSDSKALVLSDTDASTLVVPADSVFYLEYSEAYSAETLVGVASSLVASHLLSTLPRHGTTLVYGSSTSLENSLSREASKTGKKLLFVSITTSTIKTRENSIFVHPRASAHLVRRQIPRDTTSLVSFSDADLDTLLPSLPPRCSVQHFDPTALFQEPDAVAKALAKAYDDHKITVSSSPLNVSTVNIKDAPQGLLSQRERLSVVLDWKREDALDCLVQPLDARTVFSPNKTYLLVGMVSELGQSLCRFMITGGARNIVLASRSGNKEPIWAAELRSYGADVRVMKMDVTDRESVREAIGLIRQTMPAIGGVVNAALVLEAGIFMNLTADSAERQMKPKITGSFNLDQEFANENLDFFLVLGSLGTVTGNPGQCMYHAGNMFMSTLVAKRRSRGQNATVLHFGVLVDLGHVTQSDRDKGTNLEDYLRALRMTPIAEAEFHHMIVQAIISGRPGPGNGEIVMGIASFVDDGKAKRPDWASRPDLSHLVHLPTSSNGPVQDNVSSSVQNLRDNLFNSTNIEEATEAVKELFYEKLEVMVAVPRSSVNGNAPLSQLGLDSLSGIEIRKWLLKETGVAIPLMRILGRESFSAIVGSVAKKFMEKRGTESQDSKANVTEAKAQPAAEQPKAELPAKTAPLPLRIETFRDSDPKFSGTSSPEVSTPSSEEARMMDSKILETGASSSSSDSGIIEPLDLTFDRSERLSFAQASIHFLSNFLADKTLFNAVMQYTIKGRLDVHRLKRAIDKVSAHHEIYRTCFFEEPENRQMKQFVASHIDLPRLAIMESTSSRVDDIQKTFDAVAKHEFVISIGDTLRAAVVSHEPTLHTFVIGVHPIAVDVMSFGVFVRDLDRAYRMMSLSANPGSYLDFTRQQYEDLESGQLEESINFWQQHLESAPAQLPLFPFAKVQARETQSVYNKHTLVKAIGNKASQGIEKTSQKLGVTPLQLFIASIHILLSRLADTEDVCIGIPDSGRAQLEDPEDSIGHYANFLPVRFRTSHDQTISKTIEHVSEAIFSAFDNAQVPLSLILEKLGVERSPTYMPLFQVAFNYRVGEIAEMPLGDCTLTMDKMADVRMPYDLMFTITRTPAQGYLVELMVNEYLYSKSSSEFVLDSYINLLGSLSEDQSVTLRDCKLYSEAQLRQAVGLGTGPTVSHPWPETIIERLQQVCSAHPESPAVKDSDKALTYSQLMDRVKICAAALLDSGAVAGSRVAVLCEPSVDSWTAMLAVLLPSARHRAMIQECKPALVIVHAATANIFAERISDGEIRSLNISSLHISAQVPNTTASTINGESFLLFTSGSTGVPKGIKLTQRGMLNYAAAKSRALGLKQPKVLQQSSLSFDMSIAQSLNAMLNGGTLVVAPLKARGDPRILAQLIVDEGIEFTLTTPSEYLMLATFASDILNKCASWKYACSGGEAVTERLLAALRQLSIPNLTFMDCYGPTEISCAATFRTVAVNASISSDGDATVSTIGKAIQNTSIYILSETGTPVPPGIPGEICVGGAGVALGYLDAKMTSAKFVKNTFATADYLARGWDLMYKTGDKGVLQSDGSITFLGRADSNDTLVKLRGLRIDLAEVSSAILKAAPESLADAVVTVRGDPQFLVAHVVPLPGKKVSQGQLDSLRRNLSLPRYMIPSMIQSLDRLPITANGKVDRKAVQALPLPAQATEEDDAAPLTALEAELKSIWVDIIGTVAGAIGPDTDFFAVGGSSLLLVHVQMAIRKEKGVMLSLHELYQVSTLRKMALAIEKR